MRPTRLFVVAVRDGFVAFGGSRLGCVREGCGVEGGLLEFVIARMECRLRGEDVTSGSV